MKSLSLIVVVGVLLVASCNVMLPVFSMSPNNAEAFEINRPNLVSVGPSDLSFDCTTVANNLIDDCGFSNSSLLLSNWTHPQWVLDTETTSLKNFEKVVPTPYATTTNNQFGTSFCITNAQATVRHGEWVQFQTNISNNVMSSNNTLSANGTMYQISFDVFLSLTKLASRTYSHSENLLGIGSYDSAYVKNQVAEMSSFVPLYGLDLLTGLDLVSNTSTPIRQWTRYTYQSYLNNVIEMFAMFNTSSGDFVCFDNIVVVPASNTSSTAAVVDINSSSSTASLDHSLFSSSLSSSASMSSSLSSTSVVGQLFSSTGSSFLSSSVSGSRLSKSLSLTSAAVSTSGCDAPTAKTYIVPSYTSPPIQPSVNPKSRSSSLSSTYTRQTSSTGGVRALSSSIRIVVSSSAVPFVKQQCTIQVLVQNKIISSGSTTTIKAANQQLNYAAKVMLPNGVQLMSARPSVLLNNQSVVNPFTVAALYSNFRGVYTGKVTYAAQASDPCTSPTPFTATFVIN